MPTRSHRRAARLSQDYALLVATVVGCLLLVRLLAPDLSDDTQPVWQRLASGLLGLAQCGGLCMGSFILLVVLEAVGRFASGRRQRHARRRREGLLPLARDASGRASPAEIDRVARLTSDADEAVRRDALCAAFALLRRAPHLRDPALDVRLGHALCEGFGFARALAEAGEGEDLAAWVTLGAKLGAGSSDKRLAPPTDDPADLARWVEANRRADENPELQVSVGYDTGPLPYLRERGRFVALCLFVATTDLSRFQALARRPPRDPNAAFGLLIRGDFVEVRRPGQARGHRLDYVFPLPARLSVGSLAGLFGDLRLLNLGLLTACAEDAAAALRGGGPWLSERRRAVASAYRAFERGLVALLRRYDRWRDPAAVHPLAESDDAERARALLDFRLEECLYPQYNWVVPLYEGDSRWDQLLAPLRAVEGMLLHQGEAGGGLTRGSAFVREARRLGYEAARSVERALAGGGTATHSPPDPFLDAGDEPATRHYLGRVGRALAAGWTFPEELPDPETFRRAADYYHIDQTTREGRREVEP